MEILGILGSSRRGGNTETLLDLALEKFQKNGAHVSKIAVEEKKIAPCNGCLSCVQTGVCVIEDDMAEVYEKMLESEGILWATPVYFWSMTGQAKIVLDRTITSSYHGAAYDPAPDEHDLVRGQDLPASLEVGI